MGMFDDVFSKHHPHWDGLDDYWGGSMDDYASYRSPLRCNRCGVSGLRWVRQNNGKWTLFSLDVRAIHRCEPDLSGFTAEPEA